MKSLVLVRGILTSLSKTWCISPSSLTPFLAKERSRFRISTNQRFLSGRVFKEDDESRDDDIKKTKSTESSIPVPSTTLLSESFVVVGSHNETVADFEDNEVGREDRWDPSNQVSIHYDPIERLNLARGKSGVFDLEELIELLEEKNVYDTCVIAVPKEMKYVDYIVIVSTQSPKHLQAVATFVRYAFKKKHLKKTDYLPKIEGGKYERDWLALDLGNIALHIFMEEKRQEVDIETLWLVGPEYDDLTHTKDSAIIQFLESFSTEVAEGDELANDAALVVDTDNSDASQRKI